MLTTAELTSMRATQALALPSSAAVYRLSATADGMGGYTEIWASQGDYDCRIYPTTLRGGEIITGGQIVSLTTWWATFEHGTDVTVKDRLYIGEVSYEVVSVNTDESWQTAVRCQVERLNDNSWIPMFETVFQFNDTADSMYLSLLN